MQLYNSNNNSGITIITQWYHNSYGEIIRIVIYTACIIRSRCKVTVIVFFKSKDRHADPRCLIDFAWVTRYPRG